MSRRGDRRAARNAEPSEPVVPAEPTPLSAREIDRQVRRTRRGAGAGSDGGSRRMRAFRAPALLLIVALLVAAAVYERNTVAERTTVTASELAQLLPTASADDARSSTFFCAGGTATGSAKGSTASGNGTSGSTVSGSIPPGSVPSGTPVPGAEPAIIAEHTVSITNQSDRVQEARITAYPSEGDPVSRSFPLSARARNDIVLSEMVKAPYVAALVETDGGLVAVEHRLDGPLGTTVGPCASSAAPSWFFATGTTRPGARQVFTVFNPFPERAVVDLHFQVEDGSGRQVPRESDKLLGVLIPPGSVKAIDITDIIQVNEQIATRVDVRNGSGRVVVDQLLTDDGQHGQQKHLSVGLGATAPTDTWIFADSGALPGSGVSTTFAMYNPGSETVEASVGIFSDRSDLDIEPFGVTVRPGEYALLSVSDDDRIPVGAGYWAVVHSRSGGGIVVQRIQKVSEPASDPGVTVMLGSPVVATRWLTPLAGFSGSAAASRMDLSIVNPSMTNEVTVTVSSVFNGQVVPVERFTQVSLAPGARTIVDLTDALVPGSPAERSLQVDASGPVMVQQSFAWVTPASRAEVVTFPVRGTLRLPVAPNPGDEPASSIPPDLGVIPNDTLPLGTVVPGSVPAVDPESTDTTSIPPDGQDPPVSDPVPAVAPVTDPAADATPVTSAPPVAP